MISKEKLVLGLLVSIFTMPAVLAENTVIGTMNKTDGAQSGALDPSKSGGNKIDPGQTAETTGTPPLAGTKGPGITGEATPIASKGGDTSPNGIADAQLEKKIIEILGRNPEIIVGALQKFNQNQQRAQQEKLEASLMKYKNEISKDSSAVVLGKKDAEIKLVVFLDPNCPHCRPFSQALTKVRDSFPNLAIFVRHWAILGKDSDDVVRGLWAIKQQGDDKFNAATKAIASSDERFTGAKLLAWVEDHKLDVPKFKADSESKATKDVIEETKKLATDIGLEGTPTSLLIDKNGIRLVVPTDEKSLESILKGATKGNPSPT